MSTLPHDSAAREGLRVEAGSGLAINAAFLQEIKEDNHELPLLLNRARGILSQGHRSRLSPRRLAEMLGEVRDRLAFHFALEEAFGYFTEAVAVAPRLSETAEALQGQHREFFAEACRLVELAEQLLYRERPIRARVGHRMIQRICRRFESLFAALQVHEERENELILQAFDEDIGVGD